MLIKFIRAAYGYDVGDILNLDVDMARRCIDLNLAVFTTVENQRIYMRQHGKAVTEELNKMVGDVPYNKTECKTPAEKKKRGRPKLKP